MNTSRIQTIIIILAILFIIYLVASLFKKTISYEVFKARIEEKQHEQIKLEEAYTIIRLQEKKIDSAIFIHSTSRQNAVINYNTFQTTKPDVKKYDDQIIDAGKHNSSQLQEFFSNL